MNISDKSQREAINECDNPLSDLKYQLEGLANTGSSLLPDTIEECFVNFNKDLQSSKTLMTEEETLSKVLGDPNDESFKCPICGDVST